MGIVVATKLHGTLLFMIVSIILFVSLGFYLFDRHIGKYNAKTKYDA